MNSFFRDLCIAGFVTTVACFPMNSPALDQEAITIPVIQMQNAPLSDAIHNLARQANINLLLHPDVSRPFTEKDGKMVTQPVVTIHWEKLTAKEAFTRLLAENGLKTVENPAIPVVRVVSTNQPPSKFDGSLLLADDTNAVLPLVFMSMAPLEFAITDLASKAQMKVIIDPELSRPTFIPGSKPTQPSMVSARWEKITARQALAAICENFDLVLTKEPAGDTIRISPRQKSAKSTR